MASLITVIDKVLLIFFISMAFTVVCIDSQVLFHSVSYPAPLRNLLKWYTDTCGDYLVKNRPPYFMGCVMVEVFIEGPLLVACIYGLINVKRWFPTVCLIYGVSTATTMAPILADIVSSGSPSKNILLAMYLPFLIMPLVAVGRGLVDSFSTNVSAVHKARKRA